MSDVAEIAEVERPFRGGEKRCDPPPPGIQRAWLFCIVHLDDAVDMAERYMIPENWGAPIAASAWAEDNDAGRVKLFCADFANGSRMIIRFNRDGWRRTTCRTPAVRAHLANDGEG